MAQAINHKQEALTALQEIIEGLAPGEQLTPLEGMKLGATAAYAKINVENIQEVKRTRKPKNTQPGP